MKKHQPEASEGRRTSKSGSGQKPDTLRKQAEKRLSEKSTPMPPQDVQKVLHELEVHQVELEMQNEALLQAQGTIIASREKYTDLYDFAPVGYFTFDPMGLITEVNLTGASLLGVERGQLNKKPFSLFVAALFRDTFHRHYRDTLKTGTAGACELQLARKDGTSFYVSVQSVPVKDAAGNLTGVRSAIEDITDRKHAGELLQTAHDELEQRVQERTAELGGAVEDLARQAELLNLTHDAIIARDVNQRVFFWNRGAEERYGWSSDEVKGTVTDDLLQTIFPRPRQEIDEELLLRGRWDGEIIHTTRDGRKITVASRRALRRDKDGKPIAILEINSDVTEQKRIEEQLRQAQKMEAIGTLAGGIAHDFNNILAAILGFSELAADDIPAGCQAQDHLKRVHEAGLRAKELVKQILAFSRKSEGQPKRISLSPLVHETHALLRASLPTTIQMPLAITTSDDYVLADPTQVQQVLINLATNGAHAMGEEGGQLTIGVSTVTFPRGSLLPDPGMEPGTYVKVTVKDTGTGMTEEVRQRIFEPFYTTKEPGKGTGMGLAVVYGIVKGHGGAVTVQSEVGQGSIFSVFLPRVQPEINKEEETTSALPTGTERILFVDDEELLLEMGRHMLEGLGYHVTVAKHPMDAWNLFLEDPSRFDLIITDQIMPGTTGLTLAQRILRVRNEMPIVLCTGYSEIVSADKAKEVGICEFVMKPMVKRELAETIRRALDGRKAGV